MDADVVVDRQRLSADQRGQFARGAPPGQIHLEEAFLRVQKPGRARDIHPTAPPDRGDPQAVACDHDGCGQPGQPCRSIELRKAGPQLCACPDRTSQSSQALATVRASQASVTTKDAFEFLVLTAARSGEMRLATWDEMDLDASVWTVPGARIKAKRDHRVPLSARALAILHDARRRSDGTGLVFRSLRGKPLSNSNSSGPVECWH